MSTFRVLIVCTANHCRSPIAEQILTAACDNLFGVANSWIVESAGTDVAAGRPMHKYSAEVLHDSDAFVEHFRARQLNVMMLKSADIVLTAGRDHRASVVRQFPAAVGRTFTILQFARLAGAVDPVRSGDPGELGHALIREAKLARGRLQPQSARHDDLPDPMGGPLAGFANCASTLAVAVEGILRPLQLANQDFAV